MRTLQKILLLALALMLLPNCGEKAQNPLHGYAVANTAVPPTEREKRTVTELVPTHRIAALDDLNFIEGQEKAVRFKVELLAAHPEETKIDLKQDDLLKEMGALLQKTAKDTWTLKWKPSLNILPDTKDSAAYDLKLKLEILPSSSTRAKSQFPNGTDLVSEFSVKLVKDQSVPRISDRVLLSNGQRLSLGQKTEIRFQVTAGQVSSSEDLEIRLNPESQKPSRELLQASGAYGISSQPEAIATRDHATGKTITYKMEFDTELFWQRVLADIKADARLRQKLQSADYLVAEARLVIEAKNKKTGRTQMREVFIDVDLGFSPGKPELIAIDAQLSVENKKTKVDKINLKADNGQGNLTLVSAAINEIQATETKGNFKIESPAADISIRCTPAARKDIVETCETGLCVLACQATIKGKCVDADTTLNLQMKVKNTVRHQNVEGTVTRQILIKKSQQNCEGAKS